MFAADIRRQRASRMRGFRHWRWHLDEMFCNPVRKHVRNGMLSPAKFERQQMMKAEGVQKSRGYSKSCSAGGRDQTVRSMTGCLTPYHPGGELVHL
jgi:hypothetical protein